MEFELINISLTFKISMRIALDNLYIATIVNTLRSIRNPILIFAQNY